MARLFTSSIIAITLLCMGCATTSQSKESVAKPATAATPAAAKQRPQPDWVTGESRDYPRLDYITVRAQGATAATAAEEAQGRLLRLFLVDLNQNEISERQALESAGYEINRTHQPADAATVAAPELARVIEKISVADQWHDSAANTHHALAVIARNTGLGYLRSQIQMLDTNTEGYLKLASESTDPLTRMGTTAMAWRAQQLRAALQESMQQTDLTRRGIAPRWELNRLGREIDTLLVNLKIHPAGVPGDVNEASLTHALTSALKISKITPAALEKADYIISATVESSIIGEDGGWALAQGIVRLTIRDKENRERNHKEWTLKVPGIHEEAALRRALEKGEYTLKREMRNSLIDMAVGAPGKAESGDTPSK